MRSIVILVMLCLAIPTRAQDNDPQSQDSGEFDRQHNEVWQGMVTAETNLRYHNRQAMQHQAVVDKLSAPTTNYLRAISALFGAFAFSAPLFFESYFNATKRKQWKPLMYIVGVIAFCWPNFTTDNDVKQQEVIKNKQAVLEHQMLSRQWGKLAREWKRLFATIHYEAKTVPNEQIASLHEKEEQVDVSETDVPDTELLLACQREAQEFLLGTYQQDQHASRSANAGN